jgi:CHAT domain-containing protein
LFRNAADEFAASKHAEGELLARTNLRHLLFPRGRVEEAARELKRVLEIGDASNDPLMKARAWSLQALHIQESGGDLGYAFRLLKQAEGSIFPGGPYRLKRSNLTSLGIVAASAGRFDDAVAAYHRLDDLAAAEGDAQTQAIARYNLFDTVAMKESLVPTSGGRERLLEMLQRALDSGVAAQQQIVMLRSHSALADILANEPGSRSAALEHAAACLSLANKAQQPYDEAVCSWIEASLFRSIDSRRSKRAVRRALDATARANNPRTAAFSAGRHMRFSWSTKPRAEAMRDALAAVDAVETLRDLQDDTDTSADLFSAWTPDYYWLSGRLLQTGADADVSLAFAVTERMRARSLLELIDRSRPPLDARHPVVREHRAALHAIAAVQRSLMNPSLDERRRQTLLQELEALERREQEARRQMALAFPDRHRTAPLFATIGAVQSALARDEALLSFQVGLWKTFAGDFGGGSWVIVTTQTQRTFHRLPDRAQLSDSIPVFRGLLEGGSGREATAAVRLYRDLLSEALQDLPKEVKRLVVVADGALHHLPFEALRAANDGPPLGARYEMMIVPSATVWLQLRAAVPPISNHNVLTVADPVLGATIETPADVRSGALRYARNESRAIERHVGNAETLMGARASERALKSRDLGRYDILHVAAHAIVDESRPERSAILLAPGDAGEDGLLQPREIETLHLTGRIVVLSACYTAGGPVLSGEGVLRLARAFFEAGASAVIGSRWPLRDADAATLFEAFYRHLGRGASLSQALKSSQDEAREAGRPASHWAALVLLGNGDVDRPDQHPAR